MGEIVKATEDLMEEKREEGGDNRGESSREKVVVDHHLPLLLCKSRLQAYRLGDHEKVALFFTVYL